MAGGARAPGRFGLLVGGSEVAAPTPQTWTLEPLAPPVVATDPVADALMATGASARTGAPSGSGHSTSAALVSGRLAGEELERVDRALVAGDAAGAGLRLSVLLRLDPALAPVILSAADRALAAPIPSGQTASMLHLVRGDAYRILGRRPAPAAYRQAHQPSAGADRGGTPCERPHPHRPMASSAARRPIIDRWRQRGLRIVGLKLRSTFARRAPLRRPRRQAVLPGLVDFITSSPLVAMAVEGTDAVAVCRAINGATRPPEAAPGSIRGDLALETGMNLVHASDSPETASQELALWFGPSELVDYERAVDRWVIEG
jgi:nucleoside-diphosphate kinase